MRVLGDRQSDSVATTLMTALSDVQLGMHGKPIKNRGITPNGIAQHSLGKFRY